MSDAETYVRSQPVFEDVKVGEIVAKREYGPLTIVDTVRWAGVQENAERLHWDREYAREHSGMRSFIASGAHRQALLARTLTDWLGPRGMLRKMRVRHTAPTFEGDLIRFSATVVERSPDPGDPWLRCAVEGTDQEGRRILQGECVVLVPARAQTAAAAIAPGGRTPTAAG